MADAVEGERHGLQGRQVTQGLRGHLSQGVVVQPQMSQGAEAGETAGGDARDVIGVQAAADRKTKPATLARLNRPFSPEFVRSSC